MFLRSISALILFSASLTAQTVSDKGLQPYVDLWTHEETDSLKKVLPLIQKKFPGQPETSFFMALFDTDGERAYRAFGAIVSQNPRNIFAPVSLFRQIQLDVAKGNYQVAREKLLLLRKNYPDSKQIKPAEEFFAGLKGGDSAMVSLTKEVTPPPASGRFRLQVGAFSTQKNAGEMRDKLAAKGYQPIEFSEKTVQDKRLILVWVGAYATKEDAQKAGEALKQKENISFSVVEK